MEPFSSTMNNSQVLIAVTNNFILDATIVLDPRDRFSIRLQIYVKLNWASVLIRFFTLSVSAVQTRPMTLDQRFQENPKRLQEIFTPTNWITLKSFIRKIINYISTDNQ